MAFLEVEQLTKTYGTGDAAVRALDSVSLKVERGEFVAVMGASGSGKSTLLHLLGGVDRPTSGRITLDGVSLYDQKEEELTVFRRRQIGLVYQFYNLVPLLTVEENLTLPLLLDGRTADSARVLELLARLGLDGKRKAFPTQLSGGQQQRVAIARALITHPALLLADEPTGNLDSAASESVMRMLTQLNETTGQTIVMITHDEALALQAKRILRLRDGRIVKDEVRA
ncbi:MAG TPA: ABC transporter ATP-binding protein [Candidatus Fournierella merdipullorum]|uniref:ABC transporter ATP-binding protein n=1 Tax=Candidatus Allofournierella merdipullorum TaxID=2838595 RepID=A0A9D2E652_9FIRM|nr:ABC transporter ATP-binding protein [Candidatus Fournierella merdipullorum]HIZ31531.1 ABC transporter ATP-binding protein [Candidatus Fournierella merdipullorum]